MRNLVFKLMVIIILILCAIEATVLMGQDQPTLRGNPGVLVPGGSARLGQSVLSARYRVCRGIKIYTGHCQLPFNNRDDVLLKVFIEEGVIELATYEANDVLNIYGMVQHWGLPTVIERHAYLTYLTWEQFVYGIIKPNPAGGPPGYTLIAWSGV